MWCRLGLHGLPWLAVLLMVSCKGCSGGADARAPAAPTEKLPQPPGSRGDDLQILDTGVFLAAGEMDSRNHYLSTVMVTQGDLGKGEICSGVLISPRLALTAGHCVCERRKVPAPDEAGQTVIDGSACVKTAYVTTVTYDSTEARVVMGGQTQIYEGEVLPHPEFHLLLDQQGQILKGKADLALIRLDEAVDAHVTMTPLADTAVQLGELLVMAGYGHGGPGGALYGLRVFRRNRVVRIGASTDERVLYEQQGPYLYNGFNGGPCFREDGQRRSLVGIASLGSDKEMAFTDTSTYQGWLRAAIRDAPSSSQQENGAAQ
jgi:trypsin-like peptidase